MKKYFFLFIACFAIFITHLILSGHGIYGDGNGYYSYTHAIYFEKSLNFDPIYRHLGNFQGKKYIFSRLFWDTSPGPLGILKNPFPIGTGIIWIPSVAIISLFAKDKFSILLEIGPGVTGILLSLGGLYFLEKYLKKFFSEKAALLTTLTFFFASNLFYYSSFEPALSHQPSFFIISFLLWKTYKMKETLLNYFAVGALMGILFITRVPDTILLIPILFQLFKLKPKFEHWMVTPLAALLFSLPLFVSYYLMFGSPLHMPYLTGESGTFSYNIANIMEFLFSAKRGLFTWTPVYLLGLLGLISARKKYDIVSTVAVSLVMLFIISSSWSARTSAGFGQRFVIGALPFFAFGLSTLYEKLTSKKIILIFSALFIWNFLTLFQFYYDEEGLIKNDNLTLGQFITGQFSAPVNAIKQIKEDGTKSFFYNKILD